jgi:hypothetical protein
MNKSELVKEIITHIEKELSVAISAAQATYEAATHEESKPENEYDTRGLEASYLAGAQAKRVAELEEILYLFKNTKLRDFKLSDKIASTALVELHLNEGSQSQPKKLYVFLMGKGGGENLSIQNKNIQVITPASPLGEALLGLTVGDEAIVEFGQKTKEYEIISIQ